MIEGQADAASHKTVLTGTHRTLPIERTLEKLRPLLSEYGITRVANITGLDDIGIPTVIAVRPASRSLSVSQGKGLSLASAKVSAIMESIEQWHAEEADLPARFGSFSERSRKGSVVDARRLPGYRQAFDPDARLSWVEARLLDGARVEVPLAMVHLNLTLPLPPGSSFFPVGSNGLASGNTLAEAIAHGAWELVERDAQALFGQRSPEEQRRRRVSLDTVDDPAALTLLRRYDAAGVAVGVWDMTTDIGIASFSCSIVEREFDPFRRIGMARGSGCHADRGVALCRALSEAAQSRLTHITGSRDDIQEPDFDAIRSEANIRSAQRWLVGAPGERSFHEVPTRQRATFEEDLAWTEVQLEGAGVARMAYVDLSREGDPFAVVRVVIPGLEGAPHAHGYVPGARARALAERAA
jgi:YcaO-like protein with predicted kinase domain